MEIWKPVRNYEGSYEVSNLGNVRSLNYKRMGIVKNLKQRLNQKGYYHVTLYYRKRSVHQLVAESFLDHTPCGFKIVVNHIDTNPKNNTVENLELVSHRVNTNKKHIKSSSKYTGVYKRKDADCWQSQINVNGKTIYLGQYEKEIEAHLAYQKALKNLELN